MTELRFGEAQELEWNTDIDFEEKMLSVGKSMYYKNADEFHIKMPKTRAGNRVVALDENTVNHLKEWYNVQEKNVPSKWVLSYNGLSTNKSAARHIIK